MSIKKIGEDGIMSKSCVCFCGKSFVRCRNGLGKFCSVKCFQDYESLSGVEIRKVEARYLPVKETRGYVYSESALVGHTIIFNPVLSRATSMRLDKVIKGLKEFRRVNLLSLK